VSDDLLHTTLRTMTRVWIGDPAIGAAQQSGALTILGPHDLRRCLSSLVAAQSLRLGC
jgi:hypothetical protein